MFVRLEFENENHVNVNYVDKLRMMPSNCGPESIEWFMEGQAFLAVVWFGYSPIPPPSPGSKFSLFLSLPVCRRPSLMTGEGEAVGEEPNHMTARKTGPK